MKFICSVVFMLMLSAQAETYDLEIFRKILKKENVLIPFESDACSLIDEGPLEKPTLWQNCCIDHDFAYWIGGPKRLRRAADSELYACLNGKTNRVWANLIHFAVRVGGSPHTYSSYRWGYGWKQLRGYKAFSESEQKQIDARKAEIKDRYQMVNKDSQNHVEKLSFISKNFCEEEILKHFAKTFDFQKVNLRKIRDPYFHSYQVIPEGRSCHFHVDISQQLDEAMCARSDNIFVRDQVISHIRQLGSCEL